MKEKKELNLFVASQRRKNTEYRFAYGKHGNTKEVGIADPYTDSFREIP